MKAMLEMIYSAENKFTVNGSLSRFFHPVMRFDVQLYCFA